MAQWVNRVARDNPLASLKSAVFRDGSCRQRGVEMSRKKIPPGVLLEPHSLAWRPLVSGFSRWAGKQLAGDGLEAALILHKGHFVRQFQRFNIAP